MKYRSNTINSDTTYIDLIKSLPDIVYKIDENGCFTFINNSIQILGYEPEELIGKHFSILVHPDDCKLIQRNIVLPTVEGIATGEKKAPGLFDERRTGNRITSNLRVKLLMKRHPDNIAENIAEDDIVEGNVFSIGLYESQIDSVTFNGTIGIIREISESKKTEASLIRLEKYYQTLIENSLDLIFILAYDGTILYISPSVKRILGYEQIDLIGELLFNCIPNKDIDFKTVIRAFEENDGKNRLEINFIHKDGSLKIHESLIRKIHNDNEELVCFVLNTLDITERKRLYHDLQTAIQEKLTLSEKTIRTFMDASTDYVIVVGLNGEIIMINKAAADFFKTSTDAMIGKDIYDYLPDDDYDEKEKYVKKVIREKKPFKFEADFNGRYFEHNIYPIFDENNNIERVAVYTRDITERRRHEESLEKMRDELELKVQKRTEDLEKLNYDLANEIAERKIIEEALQKSEGKLRSLIENAPNVIIIIDLNGEVQFVNRSAALADVDELVNNILFDFISDEFKPVIDRAIHNVLETGVSDSFEIELITHDDKRRTWFDAQISPINEHGEIKLLTLIATDITERKKTEQRLRASEIRYRAMFENTSNGIAVYTAINDGEDFIISDFNKAAEEIDKIKKEHVIGKRVLEVYPAFLNSGLFDVMKKVWETGKPESHPVSFYRIAESEVWREDYLYKLDTGEIVDLYTDETENINLEKVMMNLVQNERQRIGHDLHDGLGQNLTGIAYLMEALEQKLSVYDYPDMDSIKVVSKLVDDSISQAQNLARGLSPILMGKGGLETALDEMAANVKNVFKIDCVIVKKGIINIKDINRATHLYYIANEAVNNAIKHANAKNITISLFSDKKKFLMMIKNDGVVQLKESINSKGLGLRIMNYRARMINGKILTESTEKNGFVVSVQLEL